MVIGAFAAAMTPGSTVPHRRIREKEGQAERKGFENRRRFSKQLDLMQKNPQERAI